MVVQKVTNVFNLVEKCAHKCFGQPSIPWNFLALWIFPHNYIIDIIRKYTSTIHPLEETKEKIEFSGEE